MRGKWRTFRALSGAERRAFVEALAELAAARTLVRFVPLARWRDRLGDLGGDTPPALSKRDDIRLVRQAMDRATRNAPVGFACLPRALAARRMLRRRGIEPSLHIGIARDPHAAERLHAWLKVGDDFVTGDCDENAFRPLEPVR